MKMRWGALATAIALTAAAAGYWVWQSKQPAPLSSNFASGNGRIEAVDIDIAAKTAGRVRETVQNIMLFAPTTHFVSFAQAILYRAAGLEIVWPQLLATAAIGAVFFAGALARFRKATLQT